MEVGRVLLLSLLVPKPVAGQSAACNILPCPRLSGLAPPLSETLLPGVVASGRCLRPHSHECSNPYKEPSLAVQAFNAEACRHPFEINERWPAAWTSMHIQSIRQLKPDAQIRRHSVCVLARAWDLYRDVQSRMCVVACTAAWNTCASPVAEDNPLNEHTDWFVV